MSQIEVSEKAKLPSFSIIVETENLASAELEGLYLSLDSIASQDISPELAKEVLILESGDVPQEMMEQLTNKYPWLSMRRITADVDYYAAKMTGVSLTTGDVIVLADSDCIYQQNWLRNLLAPFAEDNNVNVVAGETTTSARGAYGLAIALTYIFPRFSHSNNLEKTQYYFCNNVAFRRSFLLKYPIPLNLPVCRGNCVIHANYLIKQGETIWKQPKSRASHAAPNGKAHFVWRFLLYGYDALQIYRLKRTEKKTIFQPILDLFISLALGLYKVMIAGKRLIDVAIENPRYLLNLPIAIFIALSSLLLYFVGLAISYFKPNYFLSKEGKVEVNWEHS
ncbi:glycosyltransferase [Phormidium sp. LEGE 05292]|uniref:glycosyltransferase n=1 Tax=[Phormidium] sp. LEGE 05292 TaxID=767427 RepID=UPI00187EE5FE|nr:glycosyltransferase [Phormidium sp. LEGE 05292]MBE9224361.1 glycosyltransferase [Phormidium sp. LEGE 05292]